MWPVVRRKMSALYAERVESAKAPGSSVVSTAHPSCAARAWTAAIASGNESWRKPVVRVNASTPDSGALAFERSSLRRHAGSVAEARVRQRPLLASTVEPRDRRRYPRSIVQKHL